MSWHYNSKTKSRIRVPVSHTINNSVKIMHITYKPCLYYEPLKWTIIDQCKASFTLSRISFPASLRCGHRGPPGPRRSDAGKHRIESGYTVSNRRSPGCGPGGFKFFKTSGTHRAENNAGLFRGITVAPPA